MCDHLGKNSTCFQIFLSPSQKQPSFLNIKKHRFVIVFLSYPKRLHRQETPNSVCVWILLDNVEVDDGDEEGEKDNVVDDDVEL